MQLPSVRKAFLRIKKAPDAEDPNERTLIHLPNDPFVAENISNSPDGCYIVPDRFIQDRINPEQYCVLARRDEILIHINGEKTNPIPIEDALRCSPLIKQVAVVGQNQFSPAALIQLDLKQTSHLQFNEIEENILKIVEQANREAPSHSRLVPELVQILSTNEHLPVTEKGNVIRRKVNDQYSTLIKSMYEKFFNQSNRNKEQRRWTKETIETFVKEKLKSFIDQSHQIQLNNHTKSIFEFGFDSLQIIQLRNLICQEICQIPRNFLYEFSSIDQITDQLNKYLNLTQFDNDRSDANHYQLTEQIIGKYTDLMKTTNFVSSTKPRKNSKAERVFLLTGANGSLGNFLLRDLLKQPQSIVKRVYCLLRGSDTKQRLFQSFEQRKLDISILRESLEQDEKRLVILPSSMNLNEDYFGQNEEIYQELQCQITDLIHSAWKMNFNQTVKDFEYDSIFGLYNLLKFSASNLIQFHFISSISSANSGLLSTVKEEALPNNTRIALAQGYGQSKYIAEHLCYAANNLWSK